MPGANGLLLQSRAGANGEEELSGMVGESLMLALCCPAWVLAKELRHFL